MTGGEPYSPAANGAFGSISSNPPNPSDPRKAVDWHYIRGLAGSESDC